MREMNAEDFTEVYRIMEASFPEDERRPEGEQRALLSEERYRIYIEKNENTDKICAFIATWEFDDFIFVEHFAVDETERNSGKGTAILKKLTTSTEKQICLEVELPVEIAAKRRIAFYERNGFYLNDYPYVQPPISKGKQTVPLRIMTSRGPVSKVRFDYLKRTLYEKVYRYDRDI